MAKVDEIIEELKTKRDEIELKVHLASKDVRRDFEDLEDKWHQFRSKAGLERTARDLGAAFEQLGDELKRGYERIKKAL